MQRDRLAQDTSESRHILVQDLCAFSFGPLLGALRLTGRASLRYVRATSTGLRLAFGLYRLGLLTAPPSLLDDLRLIATPDNRSCEIEWLVGTWYRGHLPMVREMADRFLKSFPVEYRRLSAANVGKRWGASLIELEVLCHLARVLARRSPGGRGAVLILSPYARWRELVRLGGAEADIRIKQQPPWREPFLLLGLACWRWIRSLGLSRSRREEGCSHTCQVGVTATWGTGSGRFDDLFWWRTSQLPGNRLVYLFDRTDLPLTDEQISAATATICALGVRPVVFQNSGTADSSDRADGRGLIRAMGDSFRACRTSLQVARLDRRSRLIAAMLLAHHLDASRLASEFRKLNLHLMTHHQEAGADMVAQALELIGGLRVGFPWSCFDGPDSGAALRTHHVFFAWGRHDARIYEDAGSVSRHILLCGCPVLEMDVQRRGRMAAEQVAALRARGATCVLALFDAGTPTPNYYRFFFDWVCEDSSIGIVVKPKYRERWEDIRVDGLGGVVERAIRTGRVAVLDHLTSPAEAAAPTDFAVGVSSLSTVVVAALAGARTLYLDYAGLDRSPLGPYATLHGLGPDRCVFHDPMALRAAIDFYRKGSVLHRHLGDASPVLGDFDPFRDGQAARRIGEYVRWYLEGHDDGLDRDAALERATCLYAERWGEDAVVRGLPSRAIRPGAAVG